MRSNKFQEENPKEWLYPNYSRIFSATNPMNASVDLLKPRYLTQDTYLMDLFIIGNAMGTINIVQQFEICRYQTPISCTHYPISCTSLFLEWLVYYKSWSHSKTFLYLCVYDATSQCYRQKTEASCFVCNILGASEMSLRTEKGSSRCLSETSSTFVM